MHERATQWLRGHTFRAVDIAFGDVLRAKSTTRVSVVIPAHDEASTIGAIIAQIREDLMINSNLVDELIVIDSDSGDETATVARAAGATVFSAADIEPELDWRPGKGEAMWKSLSVTTGEVIVFVDADLMNFSSSYVVGLAAPLLFEEGISLVKAFYDRDLALDGPGKSQGGRETELTARPLISLWWPELAGVIQPLAGEWSARRALLETLDFPSGYGIEFASLIDTYEMLGLDAIAQVDLGVRSHVHQDLASLGAMAAEIIAAAVGRRFNDAAPVEAVICHVGRSAIGVADEWVDRPINHAERRARVSLGEEHPNNRAVEGA